MKKCYEVQTAADGFLWEDVPAAEIDCFPWGDSRPEWGGDHKPAARAQMVLCGDCFRVRLSSEEKGELLRAEQEGYSGLVYTDSCLELFLMPDPAHTPRYFNWEFNPRGAMYLTLGTDRFDRRDVVLPDYRERFSVECSVSEDGWEVSWRIPLSFLQEYFPELTVETGCPMRANFYQCGDRAPRPHYGCWSPIDLPEPDFHSPDFFGDLVIGPAAGIGPEGERGPEAENCCKAERESEDAG